MTTCHSVAACCRGTTTAEVPPPPRYHRRRGTTAASLHRRRLPRDRHCCGGARGMEEAAEVGGGGARCRYITSCPVAEEPPQAGSGQRVISAAGSTTACLGSLLHVVGSGLREAGLRRETIAGNNFSSMLRFSVYFRLMWKWKNQRRRRTRPSHLRFIISSGGAHSFWP